MQSGCYRMTEIFIPDLKIDEKTCNSSNCGFSAGLLVTEGFFDKTQIDGGAKIGPDSYRQYFYPKSTSV